MKNLLNVLNKINSFVWGTPTLLLIFFTGVIISIRTRFFQIRYFKTALKTFFKKSNSVSGKYMTPLQSVSTALSATMGTGNIVGVAGAIALGGPGAVFWMWVSAIFCMIIKFAEIVLAVRYAQHNRDGSLSGGAMYYIKNALPNFLSPLSVVFCLCGVVAAFGVGNATQINAMSTSVTALVKTYFNLSLQGESIVKLSLGIFCAICCAFVLKNDSNIGRFCEIIMPVMTLLYICMTFGVIAVEIKTVPAALYKIFIGAFSPASVTGGVIGSAFVGIRFGMSRGVFSNEAGLGTAPIAYACSNDNEIRLGLMGIVEVFIDTIVVCTLTALTILCAGDIIYGVDSAAHITLNAFCSTYGKNAILLFCPIVCFFAFSSVIGWGLYGTKFAVFLFGESAKKAFLFCFIILQIPAALCSTDVVWILAEITNGLMALPNIAALLFLSNDIADITHRYTN